MDEATCAFWLDAIAICAALLWFIGVMFVASSAKRLAEPMTGHVEVDRPPRGVVKQAASDLARGTSGSPLVAVEFVDVASESLEWRASIPGLRHVGSLRATSASARTRLDWTVEATSGMITTARWVAVAGLVVGIGLYSLLYVYVLPSPARGQVLQMAQAAHLLWPPFLFAGLARGLKRRLGQDLRRVLGNLRFDIPLAEPPRQGQASSHGIG